MDIEPCPCGATAEWECVRDGKFYISCAVPQCWMGPACDTREQAIAAWNRVAGQRWRPIETAEHGKEYLLYSPATDFAPAKMEVHAASWGWRTDAVSNMSYHGSATRWWPLPEPPEPPPIETSGYVELIGKETLS